MNQVRPFTIDIPDAQVDALKAKLAVATFPDELSDVGHSMGSPLPDIKRLTSYWRDGFDWRKAEVQLNQLPQFTVPITVKGFEPLDIHFVHQRSSRPNAIPLLFVHGWPGSFYEVTKLLPLLTASDDPNVPSFHVVAPSLPNFGFSEGPKEKGFGLTQYAETMHGVMAALGYTTYVTQGGDWGHFITRLMARIHSHAVVATHSNFPVSQFPKPWRNPIRFAQAIAGIALSPAQRAGLARTQEFLKEGSAYLQQQASKPQTLGYGLADSPVALLAWIYEKLRAWTDDYPWTDDEILTWISIYAFSRAGPAASVRIYYESSHPPKGSVSRDDVIGTYVPSVPIAYAYFHKELLSLPYSWAHSTGPVVQQESYDKGGHFAAFEVPELLAHDIRKFYGKNGACAGVVVGKSGY